MKFFHLILILAFATGNLYALAPKSFTQSPREIKVLTPSPSPLEALLSTIHFKPINPWSPMDDYFFAVSDICASLAESGNFEEAFQLLGSFFSEGTPVTSEIRDQVLNQLNSILESMSLSKKSFAEILKSISDKSHFNRILEMIDKKNKEEPNLENRFEIALSLISLQVKMAAVLFKNGGTLEGKRALNDVDLGFLNLLNYQPTLTRLANEISFLISSSNTLRPLLALDEKYFSKRLSISLNTAKRFVSQIKALLKTQEGIFSESQKQEDRPDATIKKEITEYLFEIGKMFFLTGISPSMKPHDADEFEGAFPVDASPDTSLPSINPLNSGQLAEISAILFSQCPPDEFPPSLQNFIENQIKEVTSQEKPITNCLVKTVHCLLEMGEIDKALSLLFNIADVPSKLSAMNLISEHCLKKGGDFEHEFLAETLFPYAINYACKLKNPTNKALISPILESLMAFYFKMKNEPDMSLIDQFLSFYDPETLKDQRKAMWTSETIPSDLEKTTIDDFVESAKVVPMEAQEPTKEQWLVRARVFSLLQSWGIKYKNIEIEKQGYDGLIETEISYGTHCLDKDLESFDSHCFKIFLKALTSRQKKFDPDLKILMDSVVETIKDSERLNKITLLYIENSLYNFASNLMSFSHVFLSDQVKTFVKDQISFIAENHLKDSKLEPSLPGILDLLLYFGATDTASLLLEHSFNLIADKNFEYYLALVQKFFDSCVKKKDYTQISDLLKKKKQLPAAIYNRISRAIIHTLSMNGLIKKDPKTGISDIEKFLIWWQWGTENLNHFMLLWLGIDLTPEASKRLLSRPTDPKAREEIFNYLQGLVGGSA